MLHGFTNDAHIWDSLAPKLQSGCDVIAVDFRGHGDSDWDDNANYMHGQLLEDIWQLIQSKSYKHWHIIGHSLGARVAMMMLADKAFTPTSFTIIDTGPEVRAVGVEKVRKDAENTPKSFASTEAFFKYLSAIYIFAQTDRVKAMAEHGLKEKDGQWVPKTDPAFTQALWKADPKQGDASDLRHPLNDKLWQALADIQCPSLILKGQASAILSKATAEKMAHQVMPNAQLNIISRAGHAIMVDNPDEFDATVCHFIDAHS